MTDGHGLSALQLTLLTGTFVIANLAAIWFIRRNFFKSPVESTSNKKNESSILDVEEWKEFELVEKEILTHNTAIYRFKLPTEESVLPLPIGQVRWINNYLLTPTIHLFLARAISCSLE